MEVAPEAVEVSKTERTRRFWSAENRLVRVVGRIPLPLGAKLLVGIAVIAALLAVVAVLGLVALGQSNSRAEKLRRLQQTAAYARLLEGDATQLNALTGLRAAGTAESGAAYLAQDNDVLTSLSQFVQDVSQPDLSTGSVSPSHYADRHFVQKLQRTLTAFRAAYANVVVNNADLAGIVRAEQIGNSANSQAASLAEQTTSEANALVAANHAGFVHSRNLLIGVGSGSLVLAVALGLLLAWSVVSPLRRTQKRLAEIAGGNFGGHVDVTNRDEIGALAADVNRMNDELESLYRELETASRHKSEFLATMSHELRTPLNAIIGFSEVLREQMFGELNERQLAYVDDVIEAGKHLLSLINDVLDLAKIEAGRLELELSQVALPELLRGAVSMHSERAGRAGVDLHLHTEPDEIVVTADERRVRQVVFNLLSNAVKFTPPGGRIDVSARIEDNNVLIAVSDTGPGIAPEDREMIFEEFEQTRDGKQVEGTGLGLPLSRKLVELHHGRLWVESEPGKGSTFRVTLPQEVAE